MFKWIINSRLATVGVAGVIAVGILSAASVAMADEPDRPGGQLGAERHGPGRIAGIVIGKVLENAGVTRDELKQGASEDMTFAEIITAYGDKSVEQAKADALAALDTRLAQAVAAGKLTQEKADQIEAAAPAAFDKLMAAKPGDHKPGDNRRGGKVAGIARHALKTVAETLGMEPKELLTQLRGGATIAGVAGDQTDEVVAALTAEANAAIDKAVADGKITAEQGAAAKSKVGERIEAFVNNEHPGKGPKLPRGPRTN
ncbi:MAG: hypothetical protein C0506_03075 [Anaerolinea sp.]|nr:hypothetical protein [Anaerolinea sp.]